MNSIEVPITPPADSKTTVGRTTNDVSGFSFINCCTRSDPVETLNSVTLITSI